MVSSSPFSVLFPLSYKSLLISLGHYISKGKDLVWKCVKKMSTAITAVEHQTKFSALRDLCLTHGCSCRAECRTIVNKYLPTNSLIIIACLLHFQLAMMDKLNLQTTLNSCRTCPPGRKAENAAHYWRGNSWDTGALMSRSRWSLVRAPMMSIILRSTWALLESLFPSLVKFVSHGHQLLSNQFPIPSHSLCYATGNEEDTVQTAHFSLLFKQKRHPSQ